jgi:seryl-tRNA synthetase
MIPLNLIKHSPDDIINRLSIRGKNYENDIHLLLDLDASRRKCQQQKDELLAESNAIAKEIGLAVKTASSDAIQELKMRSSTLKSQIKELEIQSKDWISQMETLMLSIPNAPHASVPSGSNEEHNIEIFRSSPIPTLNENALPHWELAEKYHLIDFELGNKITGSGFPVYLGKGAKLQRALINFFLDKAAESGYMEVQPPILVNEASGTGTGQLPDKEGQMYQVPLDNLYLIPTAEVPITNIYRDVILDAHQLPIKNAGYTPCFRREAGSYGAHVRGLNRLHQFDKVEIVQIAHPNHSYQHLEEMVEHVKSLLQILQLPFRILKLCGGDLGFASALTYDFEVYSAAQKKWLEVSSVSNFESFQSNRLKLRIKEVDGKNTLAHTLNGSALALPRIMAALLENNQSENGILIPDALTAYTGFSLINS